MNIEFNADPTFSRKHARLIYQQFFPQYLRAVWLRFIWFLLMIVALWQFIGFVGADNRADWVRSWGMPDSFSDSNFGPLVFIIGMLAAVLITELGVRWLSRKAEHQFASVAPPEMAEFTVPETDIVMKSVSAIVSVPLNKVTGLALSKQALAIGFSGSGMIIPRNVFATSSDETAFLRSVAKGMNPEALQRSSEAVRNIL